MAIDIMSSRSMNDMQDSIANAGKTASNTSAKVASAAAATTLSQVAASRTDAVSLTDSAKALNRATDKARASDGVDKSKVEHLKQSIKDGTYKINYESVASKLIDAEDELSSIFG